MEEHGSVGFACHWGPDRTTAWSGTPWRLRQALRNVCELVDLDATVRPLTRQALRLAWARRSGGAWHSKWAHGRPAQRAVERRLGKALVAGDPAVVVEVQDLGIVATPYLIFQDLCYDILLDHFGERGVPHFRTLSKSQILRLRDRQLRIYSAAAGLLPMSNWLGQRMVASGVRADRIHVVHPGVNVEIDPRAPVPQRRTSEARRLLFVGRDFETKAGDQVLAAFRLLRADLGPKITLTIAGPRRWPLPDVPPDGVRFLGPVPTSTVAQLYDDHDLFVMPSRFEGFGIAFVEALVRGLPCVGRNACAMPEIIEPGSGGVLVHREDPVELAEAITKALDDDDLYAECARAAPERRAHFTWERAARDVVTAIGKAV